MIGAVFVKSTCGLKAATLRKQRNPLFYSGLQLRPKGFEPPTDGLEIRRSRADAKSQTRIFESTGPTTGPMIPTGPDEVAPIDSDLAKIFAAWPMLAEPLKRAVLALIGTVEDSADAVGSRVPRSELLR